MAEANSYLSKDGLIFETILDIGKINPKEFDLEVLEMAEARVNRGTNKTFQAAINSIKALNRGRKKKDDENSNYDMDEFGLSEELYSPQQIKFIRDTIQSYYDAHDISTPYQKSGVIRLAKLECTINELEATVARLKQKDDITNLKNLQSMHKDLSEGLKLQTKQASDGDKSEDILANACIDYEARFMNDEFHFEDVEEKEKMLEVVTKNADVILDMIKESLNYYDFKKRISEKGDIKVGKLENVGKITIEELFDCFRVWEDRKMIEEKIDFTRDDNFIDRSGEEL